MNDAPEIRQSPGAAFHAAARLWQGIPGIERADNGRLWATWYTGGEGEGPNNHVVLVTSDDDGRTWTEPVLAVVPPSGGRCFDPCLWLDPQKRLWLFWAQCGNRSQWDGRGGVWCIQAPEGGRLNPAWSAPRRLCNGVMMNKPTVLSTGEWLLPAAVWSHVDPRPAELSEERHSNVWSSTDQGSTWTRRGGADVPERTFDEHMVVERRNGSLWMLVRTKRGIGESVSQDRGFTWSAGRPDAMPGPSSRFFIRRLRSGRLLLINHASTTVRSHLSAWLSEDDGATWSRQNLLLDERPGVSYPDGVEGDDNRIHVIYDHNRGDRHSLGKEREILMAVFTEQEILVGRLTNPWSRLRGIVNKVG
jgi:hypothetical protein